MCHSILVWVSLNTEFLCPRITFLSHLFNFSHKIYFRYTQAKLNTSPLQLWTLYVILLLGLLKCLCLHIVSLVTELLREKYVILELLAFLRVCWIPSKDNHNVWNIVWEQICIEWIHAGMSKGIHVIVNFHNLKWRKQWLLPES